MDLQHLRASDGTGEAVLAHVSSPRTIGSTVLELDNVDNWNAKCVVVTGTPNANGFISAAGMTVMYGHITAGDFIIDGYAPGYADNGNTTTEIAIVKMTTNWADALVDLLSISLQDGGLLKTTALDHFFKPVEVLPDNFVASGGVVAISAGLTGTFSNIVFYVAGLRYVKSGEANKVYIASKDTYVDIGTDGTVDYNDVANGAAAPALAANHIRIAKVVTSGAAITSVSQSGWYDSLGNPIRNVGSTSANRLYNPYRFRAYKGSGGNQAIPGATATLIGFNTKEYDPMGMYDTSTNKATIPVSGLWFINGLVQTLLGTTATDNNIQIWKNGALLRKGGNLKNGVYPQHQIVGQFDFKAGDIIEIRFINAAGGDTIEGNNGTSNTFEGHLVAAG